MKTARRCGTGEQSRAERMLRRIKEWARAIRRDVHALWLAHRPDLRLHPGPRLLGRRDPAAAGDPAGCPAGADLLRSKAWPIAYSMVRIRVEWPAQLFMPSLTVPHEKCRLQTN